MSNNMGKATEYSQKLRTPWLVHSLKAIIAMKQKNQDQFRTETSLATKNAVGMQRFVLHHMLNRMAEGVFSTKEG